MILPRLANSNDHAIRCYTTRLSVSSFGFLNLRSLHNKADSVIEMCRDHQIDFCCLVETWHDTDSVDLRRLRSAGLQVVDRPRLRTADDLSTNHGGVVVIAPADVTLQHVIVDQPSSFELICVRVIYGRFTCVAVVLYRPGSVAVRQEFFDDLSNVLDVVATYQIPIVVAGDFNIRLDRPDDAHAVRLRMLFDSYCLVLHSTGPTHQLGGAIDAVATRTDADHPVDVSVLDVGLSDHHLLRWSLPVERPSPTRWDDIRSLMEFAGHQPVQDRAVCVAVVPAGRLASRHWRPDVTVPWGNHAVAWSANTVSSSSTPPAFVWPLVRPWLS